MTLEAYVHGFGCVPTPTPYDDARLVVVPVPLEWSGGEVPGVGLGPLAVLGASRFIETYDVTLGRDPLEAGVATLDALALDYSEAHRPLEQVAERVGAIVADGKVPICLGGERTIVLGAARGESARGLPVGVLAVSRRPGLLHDQRGRDVAPATVGRRLAEAFPTAILGPRWWSAEEAAAMAAEGAPLVVSARQLFEDPAGAVARARASLPHRVHLSIDVGALEPAVLPMTGNVEPGGLGWYDLLGVLDAVTASFEVVGCDVAGFAPTIGAVAPSLAVAQLVLHCLGRLSGAS